MIDVARLLGLVKKVSSDPEGAIDEIFSDMETEEGKKTFAGMKKNLLKRYGCDDISLTPCDNSIEVKLTNVSDPDAVATILISDLKEIAGVVQLANKEVKASSFLKQVKIDIDYDTRGILVKIPIKGSVLTMFKDRLGGENNE